MLVPPWLWGGEEGGTGQGPQQPTVVLPPGDGLA